MFSMDEMEPPTPQSNTSSNPQSQPHYPQQHQQYPQSSQRPQNQQVQSLQMQPQSQQTHSSSTLSASIDHTLHTPVFAKAQNLMMQYHDYTQHTNNPFCTGSTGAGSQPVADDGHHFFDCPKVWERIVMHPRFEEVDIEALCAELNSKVRIVRLPTIQSFDFGFFWFCRFLIVFF